MIVYRSNKYAHVIKFVFITCICFALSGVMGQQPTAQSFSQQGVQFVRKGDVDKAKEYFLLAIREDPNYAPSYNNLGLLSNMQSKYDDALGYFNEAERIYLLDYEENIANLAGTYNNKGILFKDKGDYFQALKYYNNSLNLYLETENNQSKIGQVYVNLGVIYLRQGSLQNALDAFLQSIEIKKKYSPRALSVAYTNCALVYQAMGDYSKAEEYYSKSIQNKIKYYGAGYYKLAESYINYGQLKILQDMDEDGLEYFAKAKDISISNFGDMNPFLADVFIQQGNYYLARNDYRAALDQYQLALICAVEGFSDTNIFVNPGIDMMNAEVRLLNIIQNKANTLYTSYHNNQQESRVLDECLNSYNLVIDLIAKMRGGFLNEESKLFLTNNAKATFNSAIDIAYDGYKQTGDERYKYAAFEYAEKSKAALVSAAISDLENKKIYGIPIEIQSEEKDILAETDFYKKKIYDERLKAEADSNKINLWQLKILDLSKQYDSLLSYLQTNFPDYYALKHDHRVITVSEVQDMLASDEAVVEYTLTDTVLFISVIKNDHMEIAKKDIDSSFYIKLDFLIAFLKDNRFANTNYDQYVQYVESAYGVFEVLFGDLYAKLRYDKLKIVPDDKLGYLPFESLLTEKPETKQMDFRNLKYLIFNNQVNYSYSASLLFYQEITEKPRQTRLMAFAPTYENLDDIDTSKFLASRDYIDYLVPLKYLKQEIQGISEILDAEVFMDYNATEEVFWNQAGDFDILHFAMHTLINDANPMFSQLVFTLTNDTLANNDGLLNTYEIYNMDLNARMAVLSACNTGYGRLQKGEGIMSLARGFIYAGVPSIIMTLWAVEDQSGSELMTRFYKFLSEGDDIDEALRKAKLEYLLTADQLRAHPYLWASYVSIGKTEPIYPASGLNLYFVFGGALLIIAAIVLFFSCKRRRRFFHK